VSTDYTDPENIEKWSEPSTDFDFFKWAVKDKVKERAEKIEQEETRALQNINAAKLEGIKPVIEKKDDGGIDRLSTNDAKAIIADKKTMLSDRAKEFAELLSPGAQKRAIYDALGAASEAFGKSTGDTKQDIANAITAAAKGMGGATDTYQKARLLAIEEDIKKGIAEASYKPNTTETLINLGKSTDPEDQKMFRTLTKDKDQEANMIIELSKNYTVNGVKRGRGDLYELKANSANAESYGGTLPSDQRGEVADFSKMEKGKEYYNYFDGNFYKLNEKNEPDLIKKPDYLK
tara:strand:- start:148 stop:1020 length:873 start_codon:yes stop_codon:yes gene_type:complete